MKVSLSTISIPFGFRSSRLIFSAAGFIATRTSQLSPGVKTSFDEKFSWKPLTPASVPAGRTDLGGEIGKRAEIVAGERRLDRELRPCDLHAVAGVASEPYDDRVERFDRFTALDALDLLRRRLRIFWCHGTPFAGPPLRPVGIDPH